MHYVDGITVYNTTTIGFIFRFIKFMGIRQIMNTDLIYYNVPYPQTVKHGVNVQKIIMVYIN